MDEISRDHPADAGSPQPGEGRDRRAESALLRRGRSALEAPPEGEPISAADAAAALAAADGVMALEDEDPEFGPGDEIDEVGEPEDGLPPVPELQDVPAVARVVFVLLLTQKEG